MAEKQYKFSYKWECPFCDKTGSPDSNKGCYYELFDHLKKEHLEEAFNEMISRRISQRGISWMKWMLDNNWGAFKKQIEDIVEEI